MLRIFFLILITTLIFVKEIDAVLTINEIYPAPNTGEYEWVELYNNDQTALDLTQYILVDLANNKIKINEATLSAYGYSIASSTSVLNNSGDTIFLKNILEETIDVATYPAAITSDKSYLRCPDAGNNWYVSTIISKDYSNQDFCLSLTPTNEPTSYLTLTPTITPTITPSPTPQSSPTPQTILISYDNIFISEAYVYPQTGENEWIELYNDNDFSVDLIDWYLDDLENAGSSPKKFTLNINPKSYGVVDLTSVIYNNAGDSVRLLDFEKNLKDDFEYTSGNQGKSWGRPDLENDSFCQQESTKGLINNSCIAALVAPTKKTTSVPTPTIKTIAVISRRPTLFFNQNQIQMIESRQTPTSQVLGEATVFSLKKPNQKPYVKAFSFIGFANSLLTIASIFLRIIIHETA